MKKSFALGVFAGLVSFLSMALQGCLFSEKDARAPKSQGGDAQAHVLLKPAALVGGTSAAAVALDSVHVRVTADDIAPLDFSFSGDSLAVNLDGLPAGDNRLVAAELFFKGRLLYAGRTVATFKREAPAELSLNCEAQFSRVTAHFHLPMGMPAPIADGLLKLAGTPGQFAAKLAVQDEFGYFAIDQVPGDISYDVSLNLMDGAGKVEYEASRTGVFLALGEEAHWDLPLLPEQAGAGVALNLDPAKQAIFDPGFPARKRKPSRNGEIILSEFNAAPSTQDSAGQGEWWEIFNRTADTLSLAGCRLSNNRSGGVTRSYPFDSTQAIAPGRARVFGRSAAKADVHYSDFVLVNTAATLFLLCSGDSLAVDSLRYSFTPSDSGAVPAKEGLATSLDADNMSRRDSPKSWCETKTGGEGPGYASPGFVQSCSEN